ncbi:MAG: UDP-N-acetylmuramate dehydrogenase, partial [Desulfocapsaceae bacterium]
EICILGRGSNVLFTNNYNGLVIRININGRDIIYEDDDYVHLEIGAGEDWPELVDFVVAKGWGGIENLALVPGTAGAAPINNLACYGHNLNESLLSVEAIDISRKILRIFSVKECRLGYRTSVFKTELAGQYVIVKISLRLHKKPILNTGYRSRYESITDELLKISKAPYTIRDVYRAVVNIRQRKLPEVGKVGTVGSVFKNPLVTRNEYEKLRATRPGIHCYPKENLIYGTTVGEQEDADLVKIPAAWLIAEMGWAGKRLGNCGIWRNQPLNLVNFGNATPAEYVSFMHYVKEAVYKRYSITLEPEVVMI